MRLIRHRFVIPLAVLGTVALMSPGIGSAQHRVLGLVGGAWEYDLSGTGTSGFGGLRLELPLRRRAFLLEPGLTYARYTSQGDVAINYLLPEVQGQVQIPRRVLQPFLGGGLGLAFAWGGGTSAVDLTLSGGAGFRVRLAERWSGRAELRVRSIDPFHGTVAEWTLGIARRL